MIVNLFRIKHDATSTKSVFGFARSGFGESAFVKKRKSDALSVTSIPAASCGGKGIHSVSSGKGIKRAFAVQDVRYILIQGLKITPKM